MPTPSDDIEQSGIGERLAELYRKQIAQPHVQTQAVWWVGEPAETLVLPEPRYPVGTPEYDRYAAELRAELTKWAAGAPPYLYPEKG